MKKEIADRHRNFKQKQNETDFDQKGKFEWQYKFETFPGWKNKTIGWLRQVKQHAGEDLTESDIEEIYSEHFDGIFSSFDRI